MKLSECIYGVIVKANKAYDNKPVYKVGMVTGITENSFKEAIPIVQW